MTTPHVIQQNFSVSYSFPVVFTRGVFDSSNRTLIQMLTRLGESGPHRVLAYVDAGVVKAFPGLAEQVSNYAQAHEPIIELLAPPHVVAGGEAIKNDLPGFVGRLDELVDQRMCRHSVVLAVGGGAVLDAIGLAAALVHRGLRLIRIPTTVLAQNDSGVGAG